MNNQESKILTELTELKDNLTNIKYTVENKITPLVKEILNKIDINIYQYSEDEESSLNEIANIIDFIEDKFEEFYN
jgi:hypothetical protein